LRIRKSRACAFALEIALAAMPHGAALRYDVGATARRTSRGTPGSS